MKYTLLKKISSYLPLFIVLFSFCSRSVASQFALPPATESLIGHVDYTVSAMGESPAAIAERYNIGMNALITANPGVSERTLFSGQSHLKLATQFLLPPLPRRGIVINLPEMRLYFYPDGTNQVMTFPIGIGKIGKTIPIANTAIVRKVTNPTWTPTPAIRQFNEAQGIDLPRHMGPGPDNPLGPYAIYLRIPTYLIHSTIFPESIGRRASFGCIRMNETDIKQFYPLVEPGTPVAIIDMPNKVAWQDSELFLEAHPPLEERANAPAASLENIVSSIEKSLPKNGVALINWQLAAYLAEQPYGIPHEIGMRLQ